MQDNADTHSVHTHVYTQTEHTQQHNLCIQTHTTGYSIPEKSSNVIQLGLLRNLTPCLSDITIHPRAIQTAVSLFILYFSFPSRLPCHAPLSPLAAKVADAAAAVVSASAACHAACCSPAESATTTRSQQEQGHNKTAVSSSPKQPVFSLHLSTLPLRLARTRWRLHRRSTPRWRHRRRSSPTHALRMAPTTD